MGGFLRKHVNYKSNEQAYSLLRAMNFDNLRFAVENFLFVKSLLIPPFG